MEFFAASSGFRRSISVGECERKKFAIEERKGEKWVWYQYFSLENRPCINTEQSDLPR
jgi:hypothetical protein